MPPVGNTRQFRVDGASRSQARGPRHRAQAPASRRGFSVTAAPISRPEYRLRGAARPAQRAALAAQASRLRHPRVQTTTGVSQCGGRHSRTTAEASRWTDSRRTRTAPPRTRHGHLMQPPRLQIPSRTGRFRPAGCSRCPPVELAVVRPSGPTDFTVRGRAAAGPGNRECRGRRRQAAPHRHERRPRDEGGGRTRPR